MGNNSTIHSPLLKEDDNVLVIEKCLIHKWDIFEANAYRQHLQESDALDNQQIYSDVGKFAFTPFISAFKAVNKTVDCCFSTSTPGQDLDKLIKGLKKAYASTKVSVTLKIHVIF